MGKVRLATANIKYCSQSLYKALHVYTSLHLFTLQLYSSVKRCKDGALYIQMFFVFSIVYFWLQDKNAAKLKLNWRIRYRDTYQTNILKVILSNWDMHKLTDTQTKRPTI